MKMRFFSYLIHIIFGDELFHPNDNLSKWIMPGEF